MIIIVSRDVNNIKMAIQQNKLHFVVSLFSLCFCCLFFHIQHVSCLKTQYTLTKYEIEDSIHAPLDFKRTKRSTEVTDIEGDDETICKLQQGEFKDARNSLKNGERLEETHVFVNESKYSLMLAWASENDKGILLVLTTHEDRKTGPVSALWKSEDHGRNWKNISNLVDDKVFRKDDGLQRNPHDAAKVYLVSHEHFLYVTEDSGTSWRHTSLALSEEDKDSVTVEDTLEFHSEKEFDNYVAVVSNKRELHVTYDNFMTAPKVINQKVHAVKWGTYASKSQDCLYATVGDFDNVFFSLGPQLVDLKRYNHKKDMWETILQRITMFDIQGQFMYASIYKSEHPQSTQDDKLMMVSSDGGNTWNEVQIPTIDKDRFYSVLDMSEGLIFMHVDNPGDTGHGTLYTSSSDGIVYSESLKNHLYPNFNTVNDFYKIESIRGVFLASQMGHDKSIHTVVTYNRGGEWTNVSRPVGSECRNDEKEGCFLQIQNDYSIHRKVTAQQPHSIELAVGIVLVHAHVASNLQTSKPDVYLSTDGGYNFRKVLTGPHYYEIADSGGLLVAVPMEEYPNVIKFSTDEGHCWHKYKFTEDPIKFTGLLTEPGGRSMTISLWGYHRVTKKWTVNVIDFTKVVTKQCKDADDYVTWIPHTSLSKVAGNEGCLLGKKEEFKKMKPGSWCRNGYSSNIKRKVSTCVCSEEDFECDFGFHHPVGSTECVRQSEIQAEKIDICNNGKVEELETVGYRKVPGDECNPNGGFSPKSKLVNLDIVCAPGDKELIKKDEMPPKKNSGSGKLVIFALVLIVLVMVAVVGAYFTYKMVLLRRHKVQYRYSMLSQAEGETNDTDEFERALGNHDTLYKDSSDEEVEQENRSPQHKNGQTTPATLKSYHDDSDDDMLA